MLALQKCLVDALSADGARTILSAGEPTSPRQYFTDLRVLNSLVHRYWAQARELAPIPELNDAVDAHIAWQQQALSPRSPTAWRPLDPAVGAGLLAAAETIMSSETPWAAGELLRELLPVTFFGRDRHLFRLRMLVGAECSSGFRRAVQVALRSRERFRNSRLGPADLQMRFTPAQQPQTRFGLEHVPQWLPDHVFDRYLGRFDGIAPSTLRRVSAVRLVKLISGKSLGESAHYLGIRTVTDHHGRRVLTSGNVVKRWAQSRDDPTELDRAIEAIATHFSQLDRQVNYHHRRLALKDWSIPPDQWNSIIDDIAPTTPNLRSDFHRYFASTLVWTAVTSGERRYAPPLMNSHSVGWQHLKNKPTPSWASRGTHVPHQIQLHDALTALADELAAHIDTTSKGNERTDGLVRSFSCHMLDSRAIRLT